MPVTAQAPAEIETARGQVKVRLTYGNQTYALLISTEDFKRLRHTKGEVIQEVTLKK